MRALHCGYALLPRGFKLGIILGYRGGVYNELCALYIVRAVSHKHLYAEISYSRKRVALVIVRPRKLIAPAVQYFRERTHTAAAYSYHMDTADSLYNFILITQLFHEDSPNIIKSYLLLYCQTAKK